MNILSIVKNVKTLNSYSSFTEDLLKQDDYHVPFNKGIILSLKKFRSFEVDFFTKRHEIGATLLLLRRLLQNPPSKTWGLLGKEIASLLHFWLERVNAYLIIYCPQWWRFLKNLLSFILDLLPKDPTLGSTILQTSAKTLLVLACSRDLDVDQRLELLACINQISSAAKSETLVELSEQLSDNFTNLAQHLKTPDAGVQQSVLRLLLRWRWPGDVGRGVTASLLADSFDNFQKDSREFLNVLNKSNEEITSIPCNEVTVGERDIGSAEHSWLDISCSLQRLSLSPLRSLSSLSSLSRGLLVVAAAAAGAVKLHRKPKQLIITITLVSEPTLIDAELDLPRGPGQELQVYIGAEALDAGRLDAALRKVFEDKYQNKLSSTDGTQSTDTSQVPDSSEEDAKLSRPPNRNRAGFVSRSRHTGWKSPSTTSTASLAQLREMLAAFPRLRNEREYPNVSALPDLSCVTEVTEIDDDYKKRAIGVLSRKKTNRNAKTSPSDDDVGIISVPKLAQSSPGRNSPNNLLAETIGPLEREIISDALEQNEFIDQLIREAQLDRKDAQLDSGINITSSLVEQAPIVKACTVISKSSSEEQSVNITCVDEKSVTNKAKEVQKSTTTDESNTEAISDTPQCYVSTRRKPISNDRNFKDIGEEKPESGDETLDFFDRHFILDRNETDLVISPTLAKKINASSSQSSDSFDQIINDSQIGEYDNLNVDVMENVNENLDYHQEDKVNDDVADDLNKDLNVSPHIMAYEVEESEVLGCLSSMIDKVCNDLDKCSNYLEDEVVLQMIGNTSENKEEKAAKKVTSKKTSKMPKIKLSYKKAAPKKRKVAAKMNKLELEPVDIPTGSPKAATADVANETNPNETNLDNQDNNDPNVTNSKANETMVDDPNSPFMVRRKRKLYSPKDDDDIQVLERLEYVERNPQPKTFNTAATSYKEIEKDRQIFRRNSRNRISRNIETLSPRTQRKNEAFDQLKNTIENEEIIFLVEKKYSDKDLAVYNFSGDSSDDEFKTNKTVARSSVGKKPVTRRARKTKQVKSERKVEPRKERKKRVTKPKTVQKMIEAPLVDERMRQATPEVLNNSFILNETRNSLTPRVVIVREDLSPRIKVKDDLTPKLTVAGEDQSPKINVVRPMEPIIESTDEIENTVERNVKELKVKKSNKKGAKMLEVADGIESTAVRNLKKLKIKKEKGLALQKNTKSEAKTSPVEVTDELPPLLIEAERHDAPRSTSSSNLAENIIKIITDAGDYYVNDTNTTHNLLSEAEITAVIGMHEEPKNFREMIRNSQKNYNESQEDEDIGAFIEIHDQPDAFEAELKSSNRIKKLSQETGKNKRTKSSQQPMETVDITCINNDDQSERSISTCGGSSPITAHGDMDEAPPSAEMLNQVYTPRNLMVQNFSVMAQECSSRLRTKINYCASNSSVNSHHSAVKSIHSDSPVVSLKRLSSEDFRQWLPSPKSSTTEGTQILAATENKRPAKTNQNKKYKFEETVSKKVTKTESQKTTAKKQPEKLKVEATIPKAKSMKITVLPPKPKSIKLAREESQSGLSESSELFRNLMPSPQLGGTARKSIISPIQDFDDFVPTYLAKTTSEVTSVSTPISNLKRNLIIKPISKSETPISEEPISKSEKPISEEPISKSETPIWKSSTTQKSDSSEATVIMRSLLEESPPKRRKIVDLVSPASGSVAKVNRWLRRDAACDDLPDFCQEDNNEEAFEKLDTTLSEMNQETNERFVHFFTEMVERNKKFQEAQQQWFIRCQEDQQRRYQRFQEEQQQKWQQVMTQLAEDFVRSECRRNRARVQLLRDELADTLRRH